MSSAERIIVGVASLIALVGWLRWAGIAGSHDDEIGKQHPTSAPIYQRPSNDPSAQTIVVQQSIELPITSP